MFDIEIIEQKNDLKQLVSESVIPIVIINKNNKRIISIEKTTSVIFLDTFYLT